MKADFGSCDAVSDAASNTGSLPLVMGGQWWDGCKVRPVTGDEELVFLG